MSKKQKLLFKKFQFQFKNIEDQIINFFKKSKYNILTYKQIISYLNLSSSQEELVKKVLENMCYVKILKNIGCSRFFLQNSSCIFTGILHFNVTGNAYLITNISEYQIFISSKNTLNALPNDIVKVNCFRFSVPKHRLEAKVLEVIKRVKIEFVGKFEKKQKNSYGFVVLYNKKFHVDFFISQQFIGKAKNGDIVLIEFFSWEKDNTAPQAKIIKVLGKSGDHNVEIQSIISDYGLSERFSKEVEKEANEIETSMMNSEILKRKDMRSVCTFTIDPKDAKDFDDALSIRKLPNESYEIGVHIADVSYYVRPNSLIDREAYKRGTSIYLIDRVIPMLPEKLSNNICSLRPYEDKFTFSVVFKLDNNFDIINYWFGKTIIHSNKRFTYEDVQEIIEGKDSEFKNEILTLNKIAKKLKLQRFNNGAIAFDKVEVKFNLNSYNEPISVYFNHSKESHYLIEEFMLLANNKVSEFVSLNNKFKKLNKTYIYRVHDDPDIDKLCYLKEFVKIFGYELNLENPEKIPYSLNMLLINIKNQPEKGIIQTLAMRAMSKAKYSTKNIGHYGLACKYYTHFTSPIRRYSDLIAHRLLENYLIGGKSIEFSNIEQQAQHCSIRERLATDAERDSIKYMQVKFMKKYLGKVFTGIISGITEWGMYVEIIDNQCEGLIRLKNIKDDNYHFNSKNYSFFGEKSGNIYRLGQKVKIKVARVNLQRKQLDFILV